MLATVLAIVAPLFGLVLLGFVAGRRRWLPEGSTPVLNAFVVYLAVPALFLKVIIDSDPHELWQPGFLLAFSVGAAAAFALALLVDRKRHRRLSEASIDGLIAAYPNTGYLGIPLCLAAFGHTGLQAALIACVIPVTIVFVVAIIALEFDIHYGHGMTKAVTNTVIRLVTNPLLIAPTLGIAWNLAGFGLPEPGHKLLELLGDAAVPCALVNIGTFLSESPTGGHDRAGWLVAIKLLVQPAVTALVALVVLKMDPVWSSAAILLAALPTGTGPFMLATHYQFDSALSARAILVSTILSVATLTGILLLLHPAA